MLHQLHVSMLEHTQGIHKSTYSRIHMYTYDPGFDVETLVSPSLPKDGRAEEHIHRASIPS